jgi:CRP-like cAMP-binding protein
LHPRERFGEIAMLDGKPRSANATALTTPIQRSPAICRHENDKRTSAGNGLAVNRMRSSRLLHNAHF